MIEPIQETGWFENYYECQDMEKEILGKRYDKHIIYAYNYFQAEIKWSFYTKNRRTFAYACFVPVIILGGYLKLIGIPACWFPDPARPI